MFLHAYILSLSLLLLYANAHATIFHPNCTVPPAKTNIVAGPNVRSTLDILRSSVLTILLCTWTVLHLNIPSAKSENGSNTKKFIRLACRKLKWMAFTILLPEYMTSKALNDFVAAYISSKRCSLSQSEKWTMTHAFYANMGGFVLRLRSPILEDELKSTLGKEFGPCECLIHQKKAEMSEGKSNEVDTLLEDDYDFFPIAVNSAQLCLLISNGLIEFPSISEDEIRDKSKGDFVVKGLALCQVSWLIIQLLVRNIKDLSSTQLEIAVFGFAICTFVTFLLWFKKPKDVTTPTTIFVDGLEPHIRKQIIRLSFGGSIKVFLGIKDKERPLSATIPNDMLHVDSEITPGFSFGVSGFYLGAIIYGVCHCIAWNFTFPTHVEQILWRTSSVLLSVLPILPPLIYATVMIIDAETNFILTPVLMSGTYILYILCRLYIIVEMFRGLLYLPPSAFIATWSGSIGHIF
ncbi:hypothetical protein F5884DRAFT_730769 [Xylogone sp. PMI_703]|nr:hypothetical protein F5884DRAFT_730769 [Xylogone sp. PMI_703]